MRVTPLVSLPSSSTISSTRFSLCILQYFSSFCLCKIRISLSSLTNCTLPTYMNWMPACGHTTLTFTVLFTACWAESMPLFVCYIKTIWGGMVRIITPWHVNTGNLCKENLSRPPSPPIYSEICLLLSFFTQFGHTVVQESRGSMDIQYQDYRCDIWFN